MRIARWVIGFLCLAAMLSVLPPVASAQVAVSITIAPPELPIYVQPDCPAPGFIWMPGYWARGAEGYFWVPGTWVEPPEIGFLWTPGYWGWGDGSYAWNAGYWGPHIGFYGGVVYGFGYDGNGFDGGYWRGRDYYYNRNVANVNGREFRNVYNRNVFPRNVTRVSYNGGRGGLDSRPSPEQAIAAREQHRPATVLQREHEHGASRNREFLATVNHGRPAIAATPRPGAFGGRDMNRAKVLPGDPVEARTQSPARHGKGEPGNAPSPPRADNPRSAPDAARPHETRPAPNAARPHEMRPAPNAVRPSEARPAPNAVRSNEMRPAPKPKPAHPDNVRPAPNAGQPSDAPRAPRAERTPNPNNNRPEARPAPQHQGQPAPERHGKPEETCVES